MQLDIDKIKLAQARTGKTLYELGITQQTLTRVRKGSNTRPQTAYKLAAALGVDVADIMKGADVKC